MESLGKRDFCALLSLHLLSSTMPRARKKPASSTASSKSKSGGSGKVVKSMMTGSLIGVAIFVLSVLIGWFVALGWIKNYLKSDEFNQVIAKAASEALKSEAELAGVKWNGKASSVYADSFAASGYEDAAFAKLEVFGMSADFELSLGYLLGCIKAGAWKIPAVQINQVNVHFSDQRLNGTYEQAHPKAAKTEIASVSQGNSGASRGMFSDLLPKGQPEIDEITIKNVNLVWQSPDSAYQAAGMEVVATPTSARDIWRIQTTGGAIQGTGLPKFDVERLDFRWNPETAEFFIAQASATAAGGRLEGEGDMILGDDSKLNVDVNLTGLDLAQVVPEDWQKRLTGTLEIDAKITGDVDALQSQGTVTIKEGVLTALPVLDQLATYTRTERFRRVALNRADAKFSKNGEQLLLHEMFLQSDGLARLEGAVTIQNKSVDGLLDLGVVPGILKWIPVGDDFEKHVFKDDREGHRWTKVRVSGPMDDINHDLDEQLVAAGVETIKGTIKDILENPEDAKEKTDELIETGKELLKGLFGN